MISWGIEMTSEGSFSCKDIRYEKGHFIFSDVLFYKTIDEKNSYQIQTPQVFLKFSWEDSFCGSIEIFQPQISIDAKPVLSDFAFNPSEKKSQKSWIDWNWKLFEGELHWPEMGLFAQIDLEKKDSEKLFLLNLVSGLSKLQMEAKETKAFAHFSHWNLLLFQPWVELGASKVKIEGGFLEGSIGCNFSKDDLVEISSHLDLTDLFLETSWGEISLVRASFQGENQLDRSFLSKSPLGWMRCDYSGGVWSEKVCSIKEIEGSFFYSSDLGIKWQGSSMGCLGEAMSPIVYSMRGFWADPALSWLEVESHSSRGDCLVQSDFIDCLVQVDQLQPFWGRFALSFYEKNCPFNLDEWDWQEGEISSVLHLPFETLKHLFSGSSIDPFYESLAFKQMRIVNKCQPLIHADAELVEIHFGPEEGDGDFLIDGFSSQWIFEGDHQFSVNDWHFSGKIREGRIDASEGNGSLTLQGNFAAIKELSLPCHLNLSKKDRSDWRIDGLLAEYPFQIEAFKKEDVWAFSFEGKSFLLPYKIGLEKIEGHLFIDSTHWMLENTSIALSFEEELFHLEARQLLKDANGIFMDLRLRRGVWDLARLVSRMQDGQFFLDPLKTEILGSQIKKEEIDWQTKEKISFSLEIPASCTYLLQEFGVSPSTLSLLSGSLQMDFLYEKNQICRWVFRTDQLLWGDQFLPYILQIDQMDGGWQIALQTEKTAKELFIHCLAIYSEGMWAIREGQFKGKDPLSYAFSGGFSGQCSTKGLGQLCFDDCIYEQKTHLKQMGSEEQKISMQGKGCATFDLASFDYEMDGDFSQISFEMESLEIHNPHAIHAFFSPSKGCMIQGIDSQVFLNKRPLGICQIKLLHFRPSSRTWLLHQAHLHVPETSFSRLFKTTLLDSQWSSLHPHHDIDFVADIQGNQEFSIFSCSLKEGLLPWKGELKHIQNLEFYLDEKEVFADFFCVHQNRDVKITLEASRLDPWVGKLILQDPEYLFAEGEKPLEIHWRYEPHLGVAIDSIQGNFAGMNLAFYLQATDYQSHLIGKAEIDFRKLSSFVPPLIAEFFTELEMGKGYEMKGKLHIDRNDLSQIFFTGHLTGKQIELCGYQFRTFLAQIDIKPEEVKLFDLKISDSSGFFKMDTMTMQGKGGDPWTFQIPLLSFIEFRPSLLRAIGAEEGTISPLVIREMHFRNIQGLLEDRNTYVAEGELYFINSYKRQRTLFDVPSDVLSRIIGLDIELLIPVRGSLRYVLKDGSFQITSLEHAYSESSRSQFFLADRMLAALDLDGNLQLAIKMKQYVLFKLTESFTILIDGKLKNPRYRLQKKK